MEHTKAAGLSTRPGQMEPSVSLESTASLDSVFPKKWRALQLMDPGVVGVTLGPAQERVEEASEQPSESATDQSQKMVGGTV